VVNALAIVTVDLIDEITMIADPILATTIGIDVITSATTAVMTGATTTVAMTAMTGAATTKVTVVMIAMTIVTTTSEMTNIMIDVVRMTTVTTTTTGRSGPRRHHPKGQPNGAFQKANCEINSIVGGHPAITSNRQTRLNAREIRHVNTENPRPLRWSDSQSLSPGKIIGFTSLTPGPILWSSTP
jgi:hypothetical protein